MPNSKADRITDFHVDNEQRGRLLNALQYGDAAAERSNTYGNDLGPYLNYSCSRIQSSVEFVDADRPRLIELFITVVEYFGHQERIFRTVAQYLSDKEDSLRQIFDLEGIQNETSSANWRRQRINDVVSSIALWVMNEDFHSLFGNQSEQEVFFSRVKARRPGSKAWRRMSNSLNTTETLPSGQSPTLWGFCRSWSLGLMHPLLIHMKKSSRAA